MVRVFSRPLLVLATVAAALGATGCANSSSTSSTSASPRQTVAADLPESTPSSDRSSPTPRSATTTRPASDARTSAPAGGDVERQPVDPGNVDRFGRYQAPTTDQGSSAFQSDTTVPTAQQAQQYLVRVMADTDAYWTKWFRSVGGSEPFWFYRISTPQQSWASRCHDGPVTHDYLNAFYCPADVAVENGTTYRGGIYLPLTTFTNMWSGDIFGSKRSPNFKGDFAAAVIAAHERGHEVQDKVKEQFKLPDIVLHRNGQVVLDPKTQQPVRLKHKELVADCFAGNWANSAYYQNQLTGTDKEEAMSALAAIGDARPGGADPHGTDQERMAAFELGYNTGNPMQCITTYWVTVDWTRR